MFLEVTFFAERIASRDRGKKKRIARVSFRRAEDKKWRPHAYILTFSIMSKLRGTPIYISQRDLPRSIDGIDNAASKVIDEIDRGAAVKNSFPLLLWCNSIYTFDRKRYRSFLSKEKLTFVRFRGFEKSHPGATNRYPHLEIFLVA